MNDSKASLTNLPADAMPATVAIPFSWQEAVPLLWAIILILVPLGIASSLGETFLHALFFEPKGHFLIEAFCGFFALLIGSMLLVIGIRQKNPPIFIFAVAFFCMGLFDGLHALTNPLEHEQWFVLLHTFSSFFGGTLILIGALVDAQSRGHGRMGWLDMTVIAIGIGAISVFAVLYEFYLPSWNEAGHVSFDPGIRKIHKLTGFFFAAAAMIFYRYRLAYKGIPRAIVIGMLLIFAESAYLFSFSTMWDFTWWMWHGVKVILYLSLLVTVFMGFLVALQAVEKSRRVLIDSNRKLIRAQFEVKRVNQELEIRHDMAQEAMASLDLANAFRVISKAVARLAGGASCQLVVKVASDEEDEFQRMIQAIDLPTTPADTSGNLVHPGGCTIMGSHAAPALGHGDRTCSSCLPLLANSEEIGYLVFWLHQGVEMNSAQLQALRALTAEAGPIVNNALLYHRWLDANDFRSALLRVSAMLSSTLDFGTVLESVCRESARLLESDGAMVWLPGRSGEASTFASFCPIQQSASQKEEFAAWLERGLTNRDFLNGADGYRPEAMMWVESEPGLPSSGCRWGALAIFPLVEDGDLIGVMALARQNRIKYSSTTLAKGELLAGNVRIAIHNARSYSQLNEKNIQLKLAEEQKLRDERLAVLGQMAASVAHEVRNPLSAISNCLAVLKTESGLESRSQTALEIIQDEVQRLSKLTSDFLTFGRPELKTLKPVRLDRLLLRMVATLERHVAEMELPVSIKYCPELFEQTLLFDEDGLEMVLWNLLLNATQSIGGTGRISLTSRFSENRLLLAVSDTGKGIPASERCRIFEPFYSQRSHGVGLGLAIVQRFVEAWHGRIRVMSAMGKGTTFLIRLPLTGLGNGMEIGQ